MITIQQNLDQIIQKNKEQNKRPKLMLHSCCAPCSTYVLDYLAESFQIMDYFFNPNMDSIEEYHKRADEMKKLVQMMNLKLPEEKQIGLVVDLYHSELFYERIKGYEKEHEGGERCLRCFELRLEETAKRGVEHHCDYFATTLTISPLKNAIQINQIGQEIANKYGIEYLPSDFKKKNGYLKSTELSKEYQLYRQNYCGCIFSKVESEVRYEQKKL